MSITSSAFFDFLACITLLTPDLVAQSDCCNPLNVPIAFLCTSVVSLEHNHANAADPQHSAVRCAGELLVDREHDTQPHCVLQADKVRRASYFTAC